MNFLKHQYTNNIHGKRIAVLGPVPPPLGGVAVHVQRVIVKLKAQKCAVFHFDTCAEYRYRFTLFYLARLTLFLCYRRPEQVHVHTLYLSNGLRELEYIVQLQRRLNFEILLVEHDCRYLYTKDRAWHERLNALLPHVAQHVYIGDRTAESFAQNGIIPARKTTVEAAFLPPDLARERAIWATYPVGLFTFIDRHEKVLLANAFALSLIDGRDLYGFDLCIKTLKNVRKQGIDAGLVFVLGQTGDEAYFALSMHMIKQYDLQKHIFMVTGQKELWPLMKKVDVFLRPTLSDGASVSVQEALWCGTPVVASDVCLRPREVVLFKTGDADDLQRVLQMQLFGDATAKSVSFQEDQNI